MEKSSSSSSPSSLNVATSASSSAAATSNDVKTAQQQPHIKRDVSWPWVLFYLHLNIFGAYGIYCLFTNTSWLTIFFTSLLITLGILGQTAGSHRLWAHRTYTAKPSLRVFLMLCQTLAGQTSIYNWVQLHRLHHQKFRKEDDPCYSARNFMWGHVYAQIMGYTPVQHKMLKEVDMSDLEEDKVVMFQKKFYWVLYTVVHVLLTINAPLEYWGDNFSAAIFVAFSLRYLIVLNVSWLINSAHFVYGLDKDFKPSDSNTVFFFTKSYWPQYHYLLSNDYESGEFGNYGKGFTTKAIRVFQALDLASDLQSISAVAVRNGFTKAVEAGTDVVEAIQEEAVKERANPTPTPFINRDKFV